MGLALKFRFKLCLMNNELKSAVYGRKRSVTSEVLSQHYFSGQAVRIKPRETSIRIDGVTAEIRMGHLSDTATVNPLMDNQL